MPPGLVLTVPCYNEAARLDERPFREFLASHPSADLVLVDDGSTDATALVLERLRSAVPERAEVVRQGGRTGKGEAVRAGMLVGMARGASFVGFWDADLSTPLSAVDDLMSVFDARPEVDLVLGCRVMLMGRDIRRQAWRHYTGRVFATGASLALALPVYDTQCGAKIFRVNAALRQVLSAPFRSRWMFDVEILARYLTVPSEPGAPPRASRIYEQPLALWHHRTGSKLRPADAVRSAIDLFRIWRERRRTLR